MAKDFTNENDVKESKKVTRDRGRTLKIDQGRTPIYLLDSKYEDGFAHWVKLPSGDKMRVVCGGGTEGGGYSPEACPLCAICKEQYAQARAMTSAGRKDAGDRIKKDTNQMRGKYEMYFIAAKGEMTVKGIDGGKRQYAIDFEDAQVGILSLTKKQRDDLLAVAGQYPFMESNADLLNRYIILDKRQRGDDEWNTIEFLPAKKPTKAPEVEWDSEEINLEGLFDINVDELRKVASIVLGEEDEVSEVDFEDDEEVFEEEVESEAESEADSEVESDEEILTEDDLDEEETDVEVEETVEEPTSSFDDDFIDAIDDDFEDDFPWDAEEEEPALPKEKTSSKKKGSPSTETKKTSSTSVKGKKKSTGTVKKSSSSSKK